MNEQPMSKPCITHGMPGWPRLVGFAAAMGIASLNGIETSEGAYDFIGGSLIVLSVFWPGAEFVTVAASGASIQLNPRRVGWPGPDEVAEAYRRYGEQPRDGFVFRHWRFPFPASWMRGRDYGAVLERFGLKVAEAPFYQGAALNTD